MRWLARVGRVLLALAGVYLVAWGYVVYRSARGYDYDPPGEIVRTVEEIPQKVISASEQQIRWIKGVSGNRGMKMGDRGWAIRVDLPRHPPAYIVAVTVRTSELSSPTVWTWGCVDYGHGPMAPVSCLPLTADARDFVASLGSTDDEWHATQWQPAVDDRLAAGLRAYALAHLPPTVLRRAGDADDSR